jgi:hypothetical protein
MSSEHCHISSCGRCRFYTPIGRRGGDCQQLGTTVKASWSACSLAQPPFRSTPTSVMNHDPQDRHLPPGIMLSTMALKHRLAKLNAELNPNIINTNTELNPSIRNVNADLSANSNHQKLQDISITNH